ncbi:MAG TPA: YdeI/OmpD-associated family protein [Candidatus Acidoferrum sp.]|nr:YdeI/OmpD-associated family protein [Candidatus Acidoferrum sp.]
MIQRGYRFQATIYRIWMMRHIDVPDEVARKLKSEMFNGQRAAKCRLAQSKYIPVVAFVNGRNARTTLVPAGGGRFRMQINTALRKAAKADVGDLVGVELRLDRESREVAVPADLRSALKRHLKAWKAFQRLAPGHRRQVITYFDSAKSSGARNRRIGRVIDMLLERALLAPTRVPSPAGASRRARRSRMDK